MSCSSEAIGGSMRLPALPFQRILITGAGGFVGSVLVPAITERLAKGSRLFLATRENDQHDDDHDRVVFDLADQRTITEAVEAIRPDLVVHLAAESSVQRSASASASTWSTNLCGSLHLATALAEIVPDCTVLLTSSAEVYGLTFNEEVATEASPLRPQSPYARSKAASEGMFDDVLPNTSRLIVVRPSNHSGPGQSEAFVIPAFAAQIARVKRSETRIIQVGNLDAERDFLDVRDVICAYMGLLEHVDRLPMRAIFNVASGTTIRIGYILERLRALSMADAVIEQDPARMRRSEVSRASISALALEEAVGWKPTCTLDDMLVRILDAQLSPEQSTLTA